MSSSRPRPAATNPWLRRAFGALAWLFVLTVAFQFLLAGLGTMGGESIEPHRAFGFAVMHLVPVLMLVAGVAARMPWSLIGVTFAAFVLVALQSVWVQLGDDSTRWPGALHVVAALVIFALAHTVAQRATRLPREPTPGEAGP